MDLSLFTGIPIPSPVIYGFVVVVVAIVLFLVFRKSGKEKFRFVIPPPRRRPTPRTSPPRDTPTELQPDTPVLFPDTSVFSKPPKFSHPWLRPSLELQPIELQPDTPVFSKPVVIPIPPKFSHTRRSPFASSFKGKPYIEVVETLRNENPELNIVPVRDGSMLSKNVDHRRVRVFYNENGVVVKTPRTG